MTSERVGSPGTARGALVAGLVTLSVGSLVTSVSAWAAPKISIFAGGGGAAIIPGNGVVHGEAADPALRFREDA
jgi:hypothetical protein